MKLLVGRAVPVYYTTSASASAAAAAAGGGGAAPAVADASFTARVISISLLSSLTRLKDSHDKG